MVRLKEHKLEPDTDQLPHMQVALTQTSSGFSKSSPTFLPCGIQTRVLGKLTRKNASKLRKWRIHIQNTLRKCIEKKVN